MAGVCVTGGMGQLCSFAVPANVIGESVEVPDLQIKGGYEVSIHLRWSGYEASMSLDKRDTS